MNLNEKYKRKTFLGFLPVKKSNFDLNEKINKLISVSDSIYNVKNVIINLDNNKEPLFNASNKVLYLPDFYKIEKNDIYNILFSKFGENFEEIIAFHEMGHAVENDRKSNIHQIDIKIYPELNYLINGAAVPSKINNFLKELYKEGFADCYSALCYYKMYGDITVFDKISDVRNKRYYEMKNNNGSNYIHPNFNTKATSFFRSLIEELKEKNINILDLEFVSNDKSKSIEHYIEIAVIKGMISGLVKELKTNDALLLQFKSFSNDFKIDNDLNSEILLNYFVEFQKRSNKNIIPNELINELKENIIFKRKINQNNELMNIIEIGYSAGYENYTKVKDKSQTNLNINEFRKKYNNESLTSIFKI